MANALPLLVLAGGAALLLKKKKTNKASCSSKITINISESQLIAEVKAALENESDPIRAADIAFSHIVPKGCTKKDYKTKITGDIITQIKSAETWNLSMFYAALVAVVLEIQTPDWDDPESVARAKAIMQNISTWYSQLTGEPLPDID